MNRRLSAQDNSLNTPVGADAEAEWQDWLVDESPNQEVAYSEAEELDMRRGLMNDAMRELSERERHILEKRRLDESPMTLENLSKIYGISRERVRQIEVRAFEKLQSTMLAAAHQQKALH